MADSETSQPVKRILIVEDYYAIADVESFLCTMEGYDVRVARSGVDGLTAFAEFKPDLILLDLVLSGDIDGLEFLARIRGEENSATKVLVVSARIDDATKADLKRFDHVETLRKPFKVNDLAARIHDMLAVEKL